MLLFKEIVVAILEMGHEAPNLRIRPNTITNATGLVVLIGRFIV